MVDVHLAMSPPPDERAPIEPLLEIDEIQGNIIPGFMKPKMAVMALTFGDLKRARSWIAEIAPQITTLAQTLASRVKVREERLAKRVSAGHTDVVATLDDAWLNIAFSSRAIAKLSAASPFGSLAWDDEAFKAGLAARSSLLGDPTDPAAEGHPSNWVFGGPGNDADVLLVFGADRQPTLDALVDRVRESTPGADLTVIYEERGGKLDEHGREHFGFQDGVSQPGVRGRVSAEPDTFLTPRTIAPDQVPEAWLYGQPGQYLVWPGEFVFGYETQGADWRIPAPPVLPGPAWMRNGSYAVYRRLRQDVAGFRAFAEEQAQALVEQGFDAITSETLQALLIGRWPSGSPISRTPTGDDPKLGRDVLANNDFCYAADTPMLKLIGGHDTGDYPQAKADPVGLTCPLAAHIRKVNTRDLGNDQGGRRASFERRILRRALPFGPRLPEQGRDPVHGDRGLMFLCYQTSIVEQFEFLNSAWMGDPIAPRSPGGHDMVIGQNGQPGDDRVRTCALVTLKHQGMVTAADDVVIPTGGGYFFSPSISALRDVLAVDPSA